MKKNKIIKMKFQTYVCISNYNNCFADPFKNSFLVDVPIVIRPAVELKCSLIAS